MRVPPSVRPSRRPPAGLLRTLSALLTLAVAGSAALSSYRVRAGDTLWGIAQHYATSVSALSGTNRIVDPNRIYAGQVLLIVSGEREPGRPGTDRPVTTRGVRASPIASVDRQALGSITSRLPARLRVQPARLALLPVFRRWAGIYHVPVDLVEGLAWMESGWQASVVSSTGAMGIGQLEPDTVAFVSRVLLHVRLDPRVADDNIRMTARLLGFLLASTRGNVAEAVAGYYQGLSSVRTHGMLPTTARYVAGVLALRRSFGSPR